MTPYPTDSEWMARAAAAAERRSVDAGAIGSIGLLPRHASLRRYARVVLGGRPEIAMMMPAKGSEPDEVGGSARPALVDDPFVLTQRWLAELGQPVPAVYSIDADADVLWLEDVGNTDLDAWLTSEREPMRKAYERVLNALVGFQRESQSGAAPQVVRDRVFDAKMLRWELDHYVEWRIEAALSVSPTVAQRAVLDRSFDRLVSELAQIPLVPMHRDFQSHNLMVRDDGSIVFLDFQDAMLGPAVYDAVALLRDSYVVIPPGVLSELVEHYAEQVVAFPALAEASVRDVIRWFHMQTLQRKLKDAGRFVFIDRVKGNPDFLRYVDDSCAYVRAAFSALDGEFPELLSVLDELDPAVTP